MIVLWAVSRQAAGLTGPRVTSASYHHHSPVSWDLKTSIFDIGAQWGCCAKALYRPLCLWDGAGLVSVGTGPGGNAPDFSLALRPTSHPFRIHLQRCSQINWRPPNCPPILVLLCKRDQQMGSEPCSAESWKWLCFP